jgi:hypothetical protein
VGSKHRYLLIVACSQRKRTEAASLPAIDRYDGGSYKLLRKAQREGNWPDGLDILILSAKYGLIKSSTLIADYNQRMNRERAKELRAETLQTLQSHAQQDTYQEVYVDLGRDYFAAVGDLRPLFSGSLVIYARGRIGERLAKLKQWLVQKGKADGALVESSLE